MSGVSGWSNSYGSWSQRGLTWEQRYQVAWGTAKALQFLHTVKDKPLIHGDVKRCGAFVLIIWVDGRHFPLFHHHHYFWNTQFNVIFLHIVLVEMSRIFFSCNYLVAILAVLTSCWTKTMNPSWEILGWPGRAKASPQALRYDWVMLFAC